MTTLIANELRKLRTIRGPWLLLAAGPVLVIVGVAGEVAGGADLTQPQTAIHAVAHAGVVSLLSLVFGITAWRASTGTRPSSTPTWPPRAAAA